VLLSFVCSCLLCSLFLCFSCPVLLSFVLVFLPPAVIPSTHVDPVLHLLHLPPASSPLKQSAAQFADEPHEVRLVRDPQSWLRDTWAGPSLSSHIPEGWYGKGNKRHWHFGILDDFAIPFPLLPFCLAQECSYQLCPRFCSFASVGCDCSDVHRQRPIFEPLWNVQVRWPVCAPQNLPFQLHLIFRSTKHFGQGLGNSVMTLITNRFTAIRRMKEQNLGHNW